MEGVLGGTANAGSQGSAHRAHCGSPGGGSGLLKAEGFCDDLPIGIADLGWYLTVQTALQRLSARLAPTSSRAPHDADNPNEARRGARNPAPLRLRGYYLALLNNRNSPSAAGPSTGLFYYSPPDLGAIIGSYEIFRRATVLEHVLGLAAHGTIREYRFADAHVEAVCESVPSASPRSLARLRRLLKHSVRSVWSRKSTATNAAPRICSIV